jgi:hypothetical protein
MTVHQCGEGRFGTFLGIAAEQCGVIVHAVYFLNSTDHQTEQRIVRPAAAFPQRARAG